MNNKQAIITLEGALLGTTSAMAKGLSDQYDSISLAAKQLREQAIMDELLGNISQEQLITALDRVNEITSSGSILLACTYITGAAAGIAAGLFAIGVADYLKDKN